MKAIDLTSSLRTTPMYSLILAPVHAPNLSAPDFLSEKAISYSSPPARAGFAVAVRNSAPSIIAGDSTTTHFFGGPALGFASGVDNSARSVYGSTRRFVGMFPPLFREAIASSL